MEEHKKRTENVLNSSRHVLAKKLHYLFIFSDWPTEPFIRSIVENTTKPETSIIYTSKNIYKLLIPLVFFVIITDR